MYNGQIIKHLDTTISSSPSTKILLLYNKKHNKKSLCQQRLCDNIVLEKNYAIRFEQTEKSLRPVQYDSTK